MVLETLDITYHQPQDILRDPYVFEFWFWCKTFTKLKIATFLPEYQAAILMILFIN